MENNEEITQTIKSGKGMSQISLIILLPGSYGIQERVMDLSGRAKAWARINELFLSTAKPPLSFWFLEGEYGYVGYPFYIALFGSSVSGMGVGGWCHLKR